MKCKGNMRNEDWPVFASSVNKKHRDIESRVHGGLPTDSLRAAGAQAEMEQARRVAGATRRMGETVRIIRWGVLGLMAM